MKKLAILTVFALGMISFSVNAQQKEQTNAMDSTSQAMQIKDNFKEIDKSQLPQAIKDAIMTDMDGMMVSKAYIGENSIFKIIVASQQDESMTKTVYADAEGNWIKPKDDAMNWAKDINGIPPEVLFPDLLGRNSVDISELSRGLAPEGVDLVFYSS